MICPTAKKTRVFITFGDGKQETLSMPGNIQVEVNNNPNQAQNKCWRFWAVGGKNAYTATPYLYENYACCATAGYVSIGNTNNPLWTGDSTYRTNIGLVTMTCNGKRIFNDNYFSFGAGFENLEEITNFPLSNNKAFLRIGGCNSCQVGAGKCSITIKSKTGVIIFQTSGKCPISYEFACETDCPPDTIQCKPGCCVNCDGIKGRIDGLITRIINI